MARRIEVEATIPVKVTAKVLLAGSQVHVLEAFVLGSNGDFITLQRFDEESIVAIYNQIAAEALEQDRKEAADDLPF